MKGDIKFIPDPSQYNWIIPMRLSKGFYSYSINDIFQFIDRYSVPHYDKTELIIKEDFKVRDKKDSNICIQISSIFAKHNKKRIGIIQEEL